MANEILPFGLGAESNVMTQAEYEALAARSSGFSSGVAKSEQLNKVWRQSSFIASVLADFIAIQSGDDVLDNGNTAALLASLELAIKKYANSNLPIASTSKQGITQLSSLINSSSETLAATLKAVKTVSDAGLKVTGNLAEIKAAGPAAVAEAQANLNLAELLGDALQKANNLSEIKDAGPAAVAQTLLNLGLGDISTRLPKFIILYPDGTESAPAIMTKNIRKAIANPFPGRRVEALVEVLITGQWGATGWLYNPNVAGFGSGISAYPYGSNSSDDFIIIQSGGLEVTTSSSSAGNPHGISAQVTSAPYRIRIKTVN
ncbi:phage tail protein [Yersinia enterocolitica]